MTKKKKKAAAAAAAAAAGATSSPEAAADAGQQEDASSPVDYEPDDSDEQQGRAGEQQEEDSDSSDEETGEPRESPEQGQAPVAPPVPASVEDLEELCYTEEVHKRILAHREHRDTEPLSDIALAFLARRQRGINVSGKRKFVSPEAGDSTEIGPRELFPPLPSTPSEPASSGAPAVPAASSSSSAIVLTDDGRATSAVPSTTNGAVASTSSAVATTTTTSTSSVDAAIVAQNPRAVARTAARSYASTATNVSVTMADLRSLTRLNGDNSDDVFETLSHFRVIVGLKSAPVSDDPVFADNVALKHVALIASGEVLTLIQQILSGQINCAKAADTPDPETPGSHPPPRTWQEMVDTLLHFLLSANSIEEGAAQIAAIQQGSNETVSSYALRFRTMLSRFMAAVQRADGDSTPWNCMTVELWQIGLAPNLRLMQLQNKAPVSLREAVERARRSEAVNPAGATISALTGAPTVATRFGQPMSQAQAAAADFAAGNRRTVSRTVVALAASRSGNNPNARASGGGHRNQNHSRGSGGGGGGGGRGRNRGQGGGSNSNSRARSSGGNRQSRGSPHGLQTRSDGSTYMPCTHETCISRASHPIEDCFTKSREDKAAKEAARSNNDRGHSKRSRRRSSRSDSDSE